MQRPGPLQELPLEHYTPSRTPASALSPFKSLATKAKKRPHSPSVSHYSPAKRRILGEEGIFILEKSMKSPLSPMKTPRMSAPRFSGLLAGPGSPARVLDFGLPKTRDGDPDKRARAPAMMDMMMCSPAPSSSSLAPSPELKASGSTRGSAASRSRSQSKQPASPTPKRGSTTSLLAHGAIPRDLPAQAPPDSIHYPGFYVHQDPILFPQSILSTCSFDSETESEDESDKTTQKENLAPRRKTKKLYVPATPKTVDMFSPTPKKGRGGPFDFGDITPSRQMNLSPFSPRAPSGLFPSSRLELRRIMELEADGELLDFDEDI